MKCAYCDAEIMHPRGDKALNLGWSVIDATMGRGKNAEHIVVVTCPLHQGHAFEEFKKLEAKWKERRNK